MNKIEQELQNMESEMHDLQEQLEQNRARQKMLVCLNAFMQKDTHHNLNFSFEDAGGDIKVLKARFYRGQYEPVEFPLGGVAQKALHVMICNFMHYVVYGSYPTPLYVSLEALRDWAQTEHSKEEHNEKFKASLWNLYNAVKDVMRYL